MRRRKIRMLTASVLTAALLLSGCGNAGNLGSEAGSEDAENGYGREEEMMLNEENVLTGITDFSMEEVENLDDYCVNALDKEIIYLTAFDVDKLLAGFRETAGLDTKGATRYDGWENMLIGGHTMGHYLSAMAQAYVNPGVSNEDKEKIYSMLTEIIDGLVECQENSKGEPGFVFGAAILDPDNVEIQFDNVEQNLTNITTQAWVPWYTMHKILAGTIEVYELTGYEPALTLAEGIGDWTYNRSTKWDSATNKKVINIEYGGMNDALYELYGLTGNDNYAVAAHKFDSETLFKQVNAGNDNVLNNLHANTTIPKFIGALNRYVQCDGKTISGETVDASVYLEYAEKFWDMVVTKHTYITGGNSEWEHFGEDYVLDAERTNCNCETCNIYNMLKLSRLLFMVTGDEKYADYYETAFYNTILSSQNPETGMTTYFQPMATGYFKVYGTEWTKFWCCTGTGMENFTKLNDSIYFHNDNFVLVNLYESSRLTWQEKGLELEMTADLPESDTVTFTVNGITADGSAVSSDGSASSERDAASADNNTGSTTVGLAFRLPDWLASDAVICVNGNETAYENVGGYAVLPAGIAYGSEITVKLPMKLVAYGLPDNEDSVAFKYGPVVLSANLGTEDMATTTTGVAVTIPAGKISDYDTIVIPSGTTKEDFLSSLDSYFTRDTDSEDLRFTCSLNGLEFTPHYTRYEERYGIYFELVSEDEANAAQAAKIHTKDTVIDTVQPGYGQYENDDLHQMSDGGSVGSTDQGTTRYATEGGSFTYRMAVSPDGNNYLSLTLLAEDNGKTLKVTSGDTVLFEDMLDYIGLEESYEVRIKIPAEIVAAAEEVQANGETYTVIPVTFSGSDSNGLGGAESDGAGSVGAESARVSDFIYMLDVEVLYETDESLAYFVDCGDYDPTTISDGDSYGVYNSVTEQLYGYDPVTGMKWGLIDDANDQYKGSGSNDGLYTAHTWCYEYNNSDGLDKTESNRYTKNQYEDGYDTRFLDYAFELPDGEYDVEIGFSNPWNCSDGHDVYADIDTDNEQVLASGYKVSSGPLTARVTVKNGKLTLNFRNSTSAGLAINVTYIKISFAE